MSSRSQHQRRIRSRKSGAQDDARALEGVVRVRELERMRVRGLVLLV